MKPLKSKLSENPCRSRQGFSFCNRKIFAEVKIMNEKNHPDIGRAMNFVLRPMLAALVQKKLARHFGTDNW